MSPFLATISYVIGICGLFWLDRSSKEKPSRILWIPLISLWITGSRPLSFWFSNSQQNYSEQITEGNPFDATVGLLLIIVGLVVLVNRREQIVRIMRANPAVVLFLSYCALSCSWSEFPGTAFKRWIRLLGYIITVVIVLTDKKPAEAIRWVLNRAAFVLIPVSVLLIKYYPDLGRSYDPWTGDQFSSGVTTDKNMLGAICLVYGSSILFSLFLLIRQRRIRERKRSALAYIATLAMTFWLFSAANSMTSLSCFYFSTLLMVATTFFVFARRPMIVHLLSASIVGATFSVLFLHIGEGAALHQLGRNSTLTGRTEIWAGVLSFAGNPIFGTGYESFWLGERLQRIWDSGGPTSLLHGINEAHDGYLETYINLGWVGVMMLLAVIATGYRNVLRELRQNPESAILKLSFFVAAVIYNFTESGFRAGSCVWFAFFFAILVVPGMPVRKQAYPASAWRSWGSEPEEQKSPELLNA